MACPISWATTLAERVNIFIFFLDIKSIFFRRSSLSLLLPIILSAQQDFLISLDGTSLLSSIRLTRLFNHSIRSDSYAIRVSKNLDLHSLLLLLAPVLAALSFCCAVDVSFMCLSIDRVVFAILLATAFAMCHRFADRKKKRRAKKR